MGRLGKLLQERRDAIAGRWMECALEAYSEEASKLFEAQKNPFANPVGASLRTGITGILEALLDGGNQDALRQHLTEIIKVRAVQQFPASQAVGFVIRLKDVARTEMGEAAGDAELAPEWAELDRQIDEIALAAFDVFVECREQVFELRMSEVKRQVSWVIGKLNDRDTDSVRTDPA
ncbi:RsbRD N-terminal domain-containing protein [Gemmatimonadota bacterium]